MGNLSDQQSNDDQPVVIFMPSGRRGRVPRGTSVLEAGRQIGVDIESICNGRLTCGKCKVQIEDGTFQKHGIVSAADHVTPAGQEEADFLGRLDATECRLSCSAYVQDNVLVTVPEESRGHKQMIRKDASDRVIDVVPAVRQVYVEVQEAILEDQRGDWQRLQTALEEQWELEDLKIDYVVLRDLQKILREGDWAVTVTLWQDREVIDVRPGYEEGAYGLAVDIGSTTIAGHLCNLRTGKVLATEAMMNPQVSYGEDLMSRVSYAMTHDDGLDKMHDAVIKALNKLAGRVAVQAGIKTRDIYEAVFVGNTVMHHLLLGIDPIELGGAPFALATHDSLDIKARDLGIRLHPAANVHIPPVKAGHVGADNMAVLLAEAPYQQDDIMLIVDVGTNAEILLGNRERVLSASSPTGPALEGAQITHGMRAAPGAIERVRIEKETLAPRFKVIGDDRWSTEWGPETHQPATGICGSGIIEVVAELYLAGVIGADGRFRADLDNPYIRWEGRTATYILATTEQTSTGKPITVSQQDIRNVQLAKGALMAGTKLLLSRAGIETVDKVVLAGAFGSYIDPKHAMVLGLIPDCELDNVYPVGNAAGDGARIALLNREKRREIQERARWVDYVETAVESQFQEEFVAAMHLPHMHDPYPHLADILPDPILQEPSENGRGRRETRRGRRDRRRRRERNG